MNILQTAFAGQDESQTVVAILLLVSCPDGKVNSGTSPQSLFCLTISLL